MVTRQKIIVMALSLAFLTTYSLAFKGDELPPKAYHGPIAERPTLTPGDYWVHYQVRNDKTVTWEFIRIENGELMFRSRKRKDILYTTPDLVDIKRIHGKTGKIIFERWTGVEGCLKFPLWIGKRWSYTYEVPANASRVLVPVLTDTICRVVTYEEITVKAGTFKAFKIEYDFQARGYTDSGGGTFWYSPAAKRTIKSTDAYGKEQNLLMDYKVQ